MTELPQHLAGLPQHDFAILNYLASGGRLPPKRSQVIAIPELPGNLADLPLHDFRVLTFRASAGRFNPSIMAAAVATALLEQQLFLQNDYGNSNRQPSEYDGNEMSEGEILDDEMEETADFARRDSPEPLTSMPDSILRSDVGPLRMDMARVTLGQNVRRVLHELNVGLHNGLVLMIRTALSSSSLPPFFADGVERAVRSNELPNRLLYFFDVVNLVYLDEEGIRRQQERIENYYASLTRLRYEYNTLELPFRAAPRQERGPGGDEVLQILSATREAGEPDWTEFDHRRLISEAQQLRQELQRRRIEDIQAELEEVQIQAAVVRAQLEELADTEQAWLDAIDFGDASNTIDHSRANTWDLPLNAENRQRIEALFGTTIISPERAAVLLGEICPNCKDSFVHPLQLPCGHVFCADCLMEAWLVPNGLVHRCSLCRKLVEYWDGLLLLQVESQGNKAAEVVSEVAED